MYLGHDALMAAYEMGQLFWGETQPKSAEEAGLTQESILNPQQPTGSEDYINTLRKRAATQRYGAGIVISAPEPLS